MGNAATSHGDNPMMHDCPMFFSAEPSYDPPHLTGPAPAPVFRNPTSEAGT